MDQKRLFLAIAISVAILLGFQVLIAPHLPQPPKPPTQVADTQSHGDADPGRARPGRAGRGGTDGAEGGAAASDRGASFARLDQPAGRKAG